MSKGISAIILWTDKLSAVLKFYSALGVQFVEEKHDDEPIHFTCELGMTHFAVYETPTSGVAPSRQQTGCSQFGIYCDDVDSSFEAAKPYSSSCVWTPRDMPWGRAALLCDPDGRSVEINQTPKSHE